MEKPKNMEPNNIVIIDNLIEISLPYFVYKTRINKETMPMPKKTQAKTHKTIEGPSNNSSIGLCSSQGHLKSFCKIELIINKNKERIIANQIKFFSLCKL
jgi:hypothetical protein